MVILDENAFVDNSWLSLGDRSRLVENNCTNFASCFKRFATLDQDTTGCAHPYDDSPSHTEISQSTLWFFGVDPICVYPLIFDAFKLILVPLEVCFFSNSTNIQRQTDALSHLCQP